MPGETLKQLMDAVEHTIQEIEEKQKRLEDAQERVHESSKAGAKLRVSTFSDRMLKTD